MKIDIHSFLRLILAPFVIMISMNQNIVAQKSTMKIDTLYAGSLIGTILMPIPTPHSIPILFSYGEGQYWSYYTSDSVELSFHYGACVQYPLAFKAGYSVSKHIDQKGRAYIIGYNEGSDLYFIEGQKDKKGTTVFFEMIPTSLLEKYIQIFLATEIKDNLCNIFDEHKSQHT